MCLRIEMIIGGSKPHRSQTLQSKDIQSGQLVKYDIGKLLPQPLEDIGAKEQRLLAGLNTCISSA